MYTFLHCADLHLDSPLSGLRTVDGAPVDEIRAATRGALRNLISLARDLRVAFVVIAGDVFDGDWVDFGTGLFFNARMAELHDAGIPVYLAYGNHDAASVITRRLVLPPNVHVFSITEPQTYHLEDLDVALHGQGFRTRAVTDDLVPNYPSPIPRLFNVGVLHTSVDGQGGHEVYAPSRLEDLKRKGYDYWALGHIHQRSVLSERPHVVYPGNLQGRHARETGAKGAVVVTVDQGAVRAVDFHPLDVVRWVDCRVDLSGVGTLDELVGRVASEVGEEAERHPAIPLVFRIRLTGRSLLHGPLWEEAERYDYEVVSAAQTALPGRVWVEKIVRDVRPVDSGVSPIRGTDALRELEEIIDHLKTETAFADEMLADFKKVQSRLRAYTKVPDALTFDTVADVHKLWDDATAVVRGRVLRGGAVE